MHQKQQRDRFPPRIYSMRPIFLAAIIAFCALGACAQTQLPIQEKPITEKVEWTWTDRPEAAVAGLPNVLLVGDSITRGYYPATVKELSGVANVYLFATSCASGDARLPGQLRDYFNMMGLSFAVVHFNNGMHGWGYSEAQYAGGLPGMMAALREGAPRAALIWATTTPVLHDSASGEATNARIDERNRLAAGVMSRAGIATDDQHGLMVKHPELHNGDVHFTEAGSALEAGQVAEFIRQALGKR
jgi:lysophospholipase L1-like esterase